MGALSLNEKDRLEVWWLILDASSPSLSLNLMVPIGPVVAVVMITIGGIIFVKNYDHDTPFDCLTNNYLPVNDTNATTSGCNSV